MTPLGSDGEQEHTRLPAMKLLREEHSHWREWREQRSCGGNKLEVLEASKEAGVAGVE